MRTSILVVTLGALAVAQTLTETITEHTTVTVVSCPGSHASCTGHHPSTVLVTVALTATETAECDDSKVTDAIPSIIPSISTTATINTVPTYHANSTTVASPSASSPPAPSDTPPHHCSSCTAHPIIPPVPIYPNNTSPGNSTTPVVITATGIPSIVTSVTVVTPNGPDATAPPPIPSSSATTPLVLPCIMLAALALSVYVVG